MTEPKPDPADHATADPLASATGGRASYPTTTLADAVTNAINAGSSYYALTYTPITHPADSSYHPLHLEIAGPDSSQSELLYPRGYYAASPQSADGRTSAYRQAAMSRGAPPPEGLLFKVRALPASSSTETTVAPNNQLSAFVPSDGPFRRYDLDFLALAAQLTLNPHPNGHTTAHVECMAYVYDTEGRLLNATGTNLSLQAATTDVAKLARSLIRCHLEISVPDHVEAFLRIGIRDLSTNKFGVVEIPASTLSYLPPATGNATNPR
jgi:hypothetical protein